MKRQWRLHVVRPCEYLSQLAYGRRSTVEEVWNHPKNAELKRTRSNPEVLAPGDLVWLPEGSPEGAALSAGETVVVCADVPSRKVEVRLCDGSGAPLAGKPFQVDGGVPVPPATTNDRGVAAFEVSVLAHRVVLRIEALGLEVPVLIGALDPVSTRSGAVSRLKNLGLYVDEPRTEEHERAYLRFVLEDFQRQYWLDVTGDLDEKTQQKLAELGGGDGTWG